MTSMNMLRIEPNKTLSELMIKNHKSVYKVKYRNHLHSIEEVKKDETTNKKPKRKATDD